MRRDTLIPIFLGFVAREMLFWCAEEDTYEGHYANIKKGIREHELVFKKVLENNAIDGE